MAKEREDFEFEIDFNGGSTGFEWDKIGGHHQAPVNINYDRVEPRLPSPRLKWDGVEGGPRVKVMRRSDHWTEDIFAVKIVDPAQKINMLLPASSIVSRIIHQDRPEEMIWFKKGGELEYIIVSKQSTMDKYQKRV